MNYIKLCNGEKMPNLGLGTWRIPNEKVENIVYKALKMGYRHIDCASVYQNENRIGKVFKKVFEEEKFLKREDVFITSKLWNTHHGCVEEACRQTLKDLNLKYLDLYLVHYPFCFEYNGSPCIRGSNPVVKDEKTKRARFGNVYMSDCWKSMEKLVDLGLVKSIGISNFRIPMILDLVKCSRIQPAVHQYESHPHFQRELLSVEMKALNVVVTAFSPLGSAEGIKKIFSDEGIIAMSKKHKKTKAQVVLRWAIERGHVVIVKCSNEERLKENFDLFDFKLDDEDKKVFEKMDLSRPVLRDMVIEFWGFDIYM